MARVLLVDDEKFIRLGLRTIITRTSSYFSEIDESVNGKQALDLLEQNRYDLLITDLVMPIMGGLELMERLQAMEHKPYTIILSGHDEFKFAQKAISFGAKAYLLKPIDREELIQQLEQAERELEQVQLLDGVSAEQRIDRIRLLLHGTSVQKEDDNLFEFKSGAYLAVLNSCACYEHPEKQEHNEALVLRMNQYLESRGCPRFIFLDDKANVIALLPASADFLSLFEELVEAAGEGSAGVSRMLFSPQELWGAYRQGEYALRYTLLGGRVIVADNLPKEKEDYALPIKNINQLVQMLDTSRKEELSQTVRDIFDEKIVTAHGLRYLERVGMLVRERLVQYLSEHIPHETAFIREQEQGFRSIYHFSTLQDYIRYVIGFVMRLNEVMQQFYNLYRSDKSIELAVRYIQDNYHKDLTMAQVANHIGLNYSYFSILFKEQTGMNFVNYLRLYRIEKAKELLKDPIYKIYEVGEMVGFNNTKHFATTFRTLTGISPREYREGMA